jgi:hypothetical protein
MPGKPTVAVLASVLLSAHAAAAEVTATPLGQSVLGRSVYTTAKDCPLYKKLAAGGPRNLNTVPETLTAQGYRSWEGGCTFTNIVERYKGRLWTVSMRCSDGAIENRPRTEVWRKAADGAITVSADKTVTTLIACAIDKPVAPAKKK